MNLPYFLLLSKQHSPLIFSKLCSYLRLMYYFAGILIQMHAVLCWCRCKGDTLLINYDIPFHVANTDITPFSCWQSEADPHNSISTLGNSPSTLSIHGAKCGKKNPFYWMCANQHWEFCSLGYSSSLDIMPKRPCWREYRLTWIF